MNVGNDEKAASSASNLRSSAAISSSLSVLGRPASASPLPPNQAESCRLRSAALAAAVRGEGRGGLSFSALRGVGGVLPGVAIPNLSAFV